MSVFLRLAGVMLRDSSKSHILSRDIIHEAKARVNIMPNHIRQVSVMDKNIPTRIIPDRKPDVDRAFDLEHRLKALVLAMGDHRALTTADVTVTRLEGAWHLQQESHRDLANKYDELVYRIMALGRTFGLDIGASSDVLKITGYLDQRWHQMQNRFSDLTGALAFKNKQLRELADCLGIKTPVTESSIFEDIMVRWTDQESKIIDLEKAFKKEKRVNQAAFVALENLAKFFRLTDPVGAVSKIADAIKGKWDQSKALISHMESCLTEEKEKNYLAKETLQGLAGFMGVEPSGPDSITVGHMMDRWMESRREVNELQRALAESKSEILDLNTALAESKGEITELNRALSESKGEITELNSALIESKGEITDLNITLAESKSEILDLNITLAESKGNVIVLHRTLMKEKERTKQAEDALQGYLNRPPTPVSSASTQTNRSPGQVLASTQTNQTPALISFISTQTVDHEAQSVDLGMVVDKAVRKEHSPLPTSNGQILLRKGSTFELQKTFEFQKAPKSNHGEDVPKPICYESLAIGINPIMPPQSYQHQQDQGTNNQVPNVIARGAPDKLPPATVAAAAIGGNSNATDTYPGINDAVCKNAKRSCKLNQSVDLQLQMIKEHPVLSISSECSTRSRSLSSTIGWKRITIGPRCGSSLDSVRSGAATLSPWTKVSLLHGSSEIASSISDRCSATTDSANITITKMSDLIPWDESRSRIKLGSGVAGTVFLYRDAVSKCPVALKIVENPGQCFKNEVRIHKAVGGLPWFPAFYGSFDMAGNKSALAMEFIGGDSDDKSYTIADCLENTGPLLTKDEWFDIFNDVADGLKTLHENGFLSNDLKEDNVMLVKESGLWRAKIIDFGWSSDISKPFILNLDQEQIDDYNNHRGCRHNAPECVLEGKPCSMSSDMYSLGRLMAFVGQEFDYEDFYDYGQSIYDADQEDRPTVQEFIEELFEMQLIGGGEDGPGSSSC